MAELINCGEATGHDKMNTFEYIIKKYNINVGHQYVIEIPNMGSPELAELFTELKFNVGAEIGVWQGEFSEILCKANPKLHLYSIDSWDISVYEKGFLEQSHPKPGSTEQPYFENLYHEAIKRLSPYNCTIIRKTSMDAVKDFEDNSLDFVYLDAGHDFLNFTLDIHNWKKKVRAGGIVSGHDYSGFKSYKMIHVKEALMAYARSYHMIPFFVLPRTRKRPRRDLYGNWFWVKV